MSDARLIGTERHTRARSVGPIGLLVAIVLVASACADGNAVSLQPDQREGQAPTQPVIVTANSTSVTKIEVTVPTTAATTTTTLPPTTTTIATTTTVDPYLVQPPMFPISPMKQGVSGDGVLWLQGRLLELGFWVDALDGTFGPTTRQAVMAFQKYYEVSDRSGNVDQATADALNMVASKPRPMSTAGDLIEVNKAKQVLHIVRGGVAMWTINVSTGSGKAYTEVSKKEPGKQLSGDAQTPDGLFQVNRERPDGWWEGELGELYRPKYFRGGIAVHGSNNIPNYPASHGCVRVSTRAMDFVWNENLMPLGSPVWVYS